MNTESTLDEPAPTYEVLVDMFLKRGRFCSSLMDENEILKQAIEMACLVPGTIRSLLKDALKRADERRQEYRDGQ